LSEQVRKWLALKEKHEGVTMRKALAAGTAATAILLGSAGIANATEADAPAPATVTTVAQEAEQEDGDKTGLWGLAGLLGLLGLAGLKRRRDADYPVARGTGTVTPPPRA
jgi:MYXO-CTERM domain-containing protein